MTSGDGLRCPFNASGAINFGPRTDSRRVASSSGQVSPGGGSYGIVTSRSQSHELLSFADCSKLATRSRMQTRVTMRRYGSCNRTRTESSPKERGPVCALSALSIPSHEATDDAGSCLAHACSGYACTTWECWESTHQGSAHLVQTPDRDRQTRRTRNAELNTTQSPFRQA